MLLMPNLPYKVKKDRVDWRDWPYKSTKQTLRESVSLKEWATPVKDQGALGACSGNAVASAYELLLNKQDPSQTRDLSRLFVYYNARLLENDVENDSGVYIKDAVKAVNKFGICLERTWPYVIENFAVTPSALAYHDAGYRNIKNYFRVSGLDDSLDALNDNWPILFSLQVYRGFELMGKGSETIPTPEPGEEPYGGHAMVMVGYDLPGSKILCQNSFGVNWGIDGFCWMTFDYLTNQVMDSWIFDINILPIKEN